MPYKDPEINRIKQRAYHAQFRQRHAERLREQRQLAYAENPLPFREATQRWRARNPGVLREANAAWHRTHKRDRKAYNAARYVAKGEQIREQHRLDRQTHPEKYRIIDTTHKVRRKVQIQAAMKEHVSPVYIYKRDNGICQICQMRCSQTEASIDHIVPLSKGGEHSRLNIVLAHRRCNSRKGNRVVPQQLRLFP